MILKTGKLLIFLIVFSATIGLISCRKKDKIDSNPSLVLNFSTDTVFFDTVFSTVGSVNQRLLVFNNNNSKIQVSSIQLAGGSQHFENWTDRSFSPDAFQPDISFDLPGQYHDH